MRFTETKLAGAFVIDIDKREDPRGFFARTFCAREFEEKGLESKMVQGNESFNYVAGILRGMHYQVAPYGEVKVVRCIAGAIYDVIVDLREDSKTYLDHFGVELTAENRRALYVPRQFAHGYLALTDHAMVSYQVSELYAPGSERGLRYDDPKLNIAWPIPVKVVSEKDLAWSFLP